MARLRTLLALGACAALAAADDMETIRERARNAFGWPAASSLPSVAATARAYAAALNGTCYWPDIDYTSTSRANWLTFNHLGRVQTMVQALTAPGSPAFEDPALTTSTHCALGVWLDRDFQNANWWYQWIGVELNLQSCFLMLGTNRTTAQEQQQLTRYSYNSAWWINDYAGGANLVDMLKVEIMRGAATSNTTALSQAFSTMWANAVMGNVTDNWQGVVNDNAYHFHGQQILSPAYGAEWLSSLLQFWQVAAGTQWAMPDDHVAVMAEFISEGDALISFGGRYDWGTEGRGIDRPGTTFAWGLPVSTMAQLATEPGAAPWAQGLLDFAARVNGTVPASASNWTVSKYFWTSDFYVHHRPGWGAALKMHGNNSAWTVTQNECDNFENLKAEHTGDGVLNVYTSDTPTVAAEAYATIFPLLDWSAINGITVEHDTPLEYCGPETGDVWAVRNTAFVGGVSDGQYGAAAMDTATHNTTAQRSWLFFDSGILAVASNLTNGYGSIPRAADVWTTLVSRLVPQPAANPARGNMAVAFTNGSVVTALPDGNYSYAGGDVAWLSVDSLGVVPAVTAAGDGGVSTLGVHATAPTLGLSIGQRTGDWSTIGAYTGTVTGRLAMAWLDHGSALPAAGAATAGYAYLLAPNTTAAAMPAFAAANGYFSCVTASETVHGAAQVQGQGSGSVAAAVFWSEGGGTFACPALGLNITVAGSGMVLFREQQEGSGGSKTASVTVSHPFKSAQAVAVTITGRSATGAACTPGSAPGSTVFSVALPADPNLMGSSVTATCSM